MTPSEGRGRRGRERSQPLVMNKTMTQQQLERFRAHLYALKNLLNQLADESMRYAADKHTATLVAQELQLLEQEIPGLVPPLRLEDLYERVSGAQPYYRAQGLRSHLAIAVGKLEAEIQPPESNPVEEREFLYVKNAKLRKILKRDYQELQRASIASCWKSVLILAAVAIETILVDLLLQHESAAKTASKAPKKPNIIDWDLADLINVCVERQLVSPGVEKLSHSVREYRNLIHPGNELRTGLTFDVEEAKIAIEVLHMIDRHLSQ